MMNHAQTNPAQNPPTRQRGRWFYRLVRLLFTSALRLELIARTAERRREYAEYQARMTREDIERTCTWAAAERSRNETLRRLLDRHHEARALALPGYEVSELARETAEALGKPNAGDEPTAHRATEKL